MDNLNGCTLDGLRPPEMAPVVLRRSPLARRSSQLITRQRPPCADVPGANRLRDPSALLIVPLPAASRQAPATGTTDQIGMLTAAFAAAIDFERQRLAKVLHDELAQSLFVARLRLSSIVLGSQGDAVGDALRAIGECLAISTKATRDLITELSAPFASESRPPLLVISPAGTGDSEAPAPGPRQNLRAALVVVGRRIHRQFHLRVTVAGTTPIEPGIESRIAICSAVRELLMNVIKHARVEEAWVHLSGDDCCIRIEVEDHGAGFDPAALAFCATTEGGFGLHSIQKVLAATGGHLQLTSAAGRGTKATLLIPLPPTGAAIPHTLNDPSDQSD